LTASKALKTNITPVEPSEKEFKLIEEYVRTTHAKTHSSYALKIKTVFRIEREGEDEKFTAFEKTPNHKLLWHGSRMTNFCGILSQGLRIAPPEAPATGYMFGKGIYFADMVSKSANYCFANPQRPEGLALLCQVALGNPCEFKQAQNHLTTAPSGFDCTKGVGRSFPDPKKEVPLPLDAKCKIPLGPSVDGNANDLSLLYNEFIVYKTSQVKMRYLIHFDFDFRKGY